MVPFLLTVLLGQPNPNGKKRVSQTAVHFVRLLSRPLRHFRKGKGTSHPEGGGKLPLLEWKLLLYFFRAYRYFEIKKRFMDEVIGMTSGSTKQVGFVLRKERNIHGHLDKFS